MPILRSRLLHWLLIPAFVVVVLALTHTVWLGALGAFLVRDDPPFRADMVVVLAGDDSGRRVLMAGEVMRQGYAPLAIVSGPCCWYGIHEDEGAIRFAARMGYPREWFIPLPNHSRSTREEAGVVLAELRRRGVRRFILVTSNFHTRRAGRAYRALTRGEEFRVMAAPDKTFRPDDWWRNREGQKTTFFEWSKTLADWAGL